MAVVVDHLKKYQNIWLDLWLKIVSKERLLSVDIEFSYGVCGLCYVWKLILYFYSYINIKEILIFGTAALTIYNKFNTAFYL